MRSKYVPPFHNNGREQSIIIKIISNLLAYLFSMFIEYVFSDKIRPFEFFPT